MEERDTLAAWAESFAIMARYDDGWSLIIARDDGVRVSIDNAAFSDTDRARLLALGWTLHESGYCSKPA